MRPTRRELLAAVGGGATIGTAGCVDLLLGTGPTTFAAKEPSVADSALSNSGYEHVETELKTVEKTIEIESQQRTVKLENYLAKYRHPVELPEAGTIEDGALFTAFATPQIKILDQTINPIAELDIQALAKQLLVLYAAVTVGEQIEQLQLETLGAAREFGRFAGLVTVASTELDALFDLGKIQHAEDILVLLGSYPQLLKTEEAQNVETLVGGVEHQPGEQ